MERDYRKLKGRIVEMYGTQTELAKKIGWSERTLSLKMNGKIDFNQSDIEKMMALLKITEEEIPVYFFTNKVQNI